MVDLQNLRQVLLVVETNEAVRALRRRALETEHWSVVLACTGEDIRDHLRNARPTLILCAKDIPDSLVRALDESHAHRLFYDKPFQLAELRKAVREQLLSATLH